MVRPCDCASCTFHTWRYGTGYGTLQAQSPCPSLPVQTPAQICCPWPTYIEHNHQHIHACLPQVTVPTAPAKPEKEGEKKPKEKSKTALLPPSKAATVVSAASTQLSAASTAVLSKAPTAKHPSKANTPPSVGPGGNYMYPPQHTKLHIFNKAAKVWDVKYATQKLKFKIFTASTLLTPAMVGNGRWAKGTTIAYTEPRAKDSLASMGWIARRGDDLPPVWLTVHKA
ncbi:hypothetical protein B0A48_14478 [Cryoendolithus antarcticus]|uniref:Uncharacterized protein n=1 Tax=Cryoendolithus antarcticus TaxID=1507870 RepID=A0A1V8SKQ5_9PEZI|nr:hypothetical protein B0A48_14478 [Cryoendolithus antarcticus]